jgi:hypothetical protein
MRERATDVLDDASPRTAARVSGSVAMTASEVGRHDRQRGRSP